MDLDRIRALLRLVSESGVAEVEIEEDDFKLVIRRDTPSVTFQPSMPYMPSYQPMYGPQAPPPAAPPAPNPAGNATPVSQTAPGPAASNPTSEAVVESAAAEGSGTVVKAPIVGTFYRAASPDSDPFINVGDTVATGDVLCIIEAMKLMNEIEAEIGGIVRKILVEDAQPVEYDQPLFVVDPV